MPVSLSLILLLTAVQQYLLAINAAPVINAAGNAGFVAVTA
jgi:hypothetical protein